jgi:hypothetical protein
MPVLTTAPPSPHRYARKAAALHGLKRYMDAITTYDEALRFESGDKGALLQGRQQSSFALAIEE